MNRHQTWTQGGSDTGILISDRLTPIPPDELAARARRLRLAAFATQPQTLGSALAMLSDLIRELGLDV